MTVDTGNVQAALYGALIAADVAGGRVYDGQKQQENPVPGSPIVNIGPKTVVNDDDTSGDALEVTFQLDIWSRYDGSKEINEVQTAIRAALHLANLTVSGLTSCNTFVDGYSDFLDPDGETRHGVVRVRCHCRA
jgi:hypothetical protein